MARAFLVTPKKFRQSMGGGIIAPEMTTIVESRGNNQEPYFEEVVARYKYQYQIDIRRMSLNLNDFTYKILK